MVIDRSGTSENVYMMSLVDENDLAEFLDETKETEKKEESCLLYTSKGNCSPKLWRTDIPIGEMRG